MSPITNWGAIAEDASKIPANSFEPAPVGNYTFTIDAAEAGVSKAGNQKFSITTHIDAGPSANKKVWHDLTLNQDPSKTNSLRIFFENMAVFGMPFEWFTAATSDEEIVANLLGKRFQADITIEEWQGKKNNKITGYTIREATTLPDSANAGVPQFDAPMAAAAPPPAADPWQTPAAQTPPPAAPAPTVAAAPPLATPPTATPNVENPWGTPPPAAPAF